MVQIRLVRHNYQGHKILARYMFLKYARSAECRAIKVSFISYVLQSSFLFRGYQNEEQESTSRVSLHQRRQGATGTH
jgi:hypothetical protein